MPASFFRSSRSEPVRFAAAFLVLLVVLGAAAAAAVVGDDYAVAEGHGSLMVALGCFWCAEQAFEQYAPGVVEAVSGYAGGINENPTYRNHPGHYEVILIEYDPSKTSYEVLVNYAYRNMDPFDGTGQFCDRGSSYYPAIFYATEEERSIAEDVLETILLDNDDWDAADIAAPILPRPVFWTAEGYHQDYYIKNPSNYGFYKNGCRRPQRLKEVWGEEEYKCYHEEAHTCFFTADSDSATTPYFDPELYPQDDAGNATTTFLDGDDADGDGGDGIAEEDRKTPPARLSIVNADGELVSAESNIKNADVERAGLLPSWAVALLTVLAVAVAAFAAVGLFVVGLRKRHGGGGGGSKRNPEDVDDDDDDDDAKEAA